MAVRLRDETWELAGLNVTVRRGGSGSPILFLHGEDGLLFDDHLLQQLAEQFDVIAPMHPGWGPEERPAWVTTVSDIADVYQELLRRFDHPVPVIGVSFGGWVAAEMAATCEHRMAAVLLVSPVGLKFADRESRSFVDLYITDLDVLQVALYGTPDSAPSLKDLSADQFLELARAQESTARYCWSPYMHDPKLGRRLSHVTIPTLLLASETDGFALETDYYKRFAACIGSGAPVVMIPDGAHRLDEVCPYEIVKAASALLNETTDKSRASSEVRQ